MTPDPELARLITRAEFAASRFSRSVDRLTAAENERDEAHRAMMETEQAVTAYRAAHPDAQGELL